MKKLLFLVFILSGLTSFGQFLNYTNINGRYKWIAGKFDSTFTLPSGTTPSLRTGGGNAPGALFYNTSDSVVYEYTGSQWRPLHGSDTSKVQIAYVRNTSGSSMTTGQVVYINGSTGNVPTIALANNKSDSSSAVTFGIVRGNMANNAFGWVTTFGPISGVNTNAYTEGESIYLDSIGGQFTHTKPVAPYHMVVLGYVIKKAASGILFVKIQNGYELEELHNVKITAPVLNKSVIIYDSVKGLWVDTTVTAAGLGLGGSGTADYVAKWTSSTALGNSLIQDDGSNVTVNGGLSVYNKDFYQQTPSTVQFYIKNSSGNVVIGNGITDAGYRLDVNGTARMKNALWIYSVNTADDIINFHTGSTYIKRPVSSTEFHIGNSLGSGIQFFTSSEKMRLTGNGRLLIGTAIESTYDLDVVGDIRSTLDANINGITVGKGLASVSTNTAVGVSALGSITSGSDNTGIGNSSFRVTTNGSANTGLGYATGFDNVSGSNNVYVGDFAGRTATGSYNTIVGSQAGRTTTAGYNTFLGYATGYSVTSGTYNTILGRTDPGVTTGSYNTIIGSQITGLSSSLANTIILADGQGNQRFYIDNNGLAAIGTTSPNASSILTLSSTSKGFLPPVMTGAQAEAITSPAEGLMIYANNGNGTTITSKGWWGYTGTTWVKLN